MRRETPCIPSGDEQSNEVQFQINAFDVTPLAGGDGASLTDYGVALEELQITSNTTDHRIATGAQSDHLYTACKNNNTCDSCPDETCAVLCSLPSCDRQ